jgi:hypothetical protein
MNANLNELNCKHNQRAFTRFTVPGATVSWMPNGQNKYSEANMPLSDISKGGLSFLTNEPPEVEADIYIRISLHQGSAPIELIGRVVYASPFGPGLIYKYRIGVEMKKHVQSKDGNGVTSSQVIEAFECKYGQKD